MEKWQELLSECFPVFMTTETTGVSSNDTISALSLREPVVSPAQVLLFDVEAAAGAEAESRAAKFMGMSQDQFHASPKSNDGTVIELLNPVFEYCQAWNLKPVAVTYNPAFQRRFFDILGTGMGESMYWLDICKLCWCLTNVNVESMDAGSIPELLESMDAFTNGAKKMGYKDIMAAWGIPLPNPCPPATKTEHVQKLWNKISHWTSGCNVWQLPDKDTAYPVMATLTESR